jgi:hypothetical protein
MPSFAVEETAFGTMFAHKVMPWFEAALATGGLHARDSLVLR